MMMRWLLCGLLLLSACTTIPLKEAAIAPASSHPLGYTLPPAAPNLYDNAVFDRFTPVVKRLFQINGVKLSDWLVAAVVDEPVRSTGETFPKDTLLVHRVGYVMDARNKVYGRVIAMVETLINPQTQDRLILFWFDMGWVQQGEPNGVWSETRGTLKPVSKREAAIVMTPVHLLVANGYLQYAKNHGLPVPKIPVVPVGTERKHHAAMR